MFGSEERMFYEDEFRADLGKYSRAEKDFPTREGPHPAA